MKVSTLTLIGALVALPLVISAQDVKSDEVYPMGSTPAKQFSYVDMKVGTFLDACHIDTCSEPDGKLPAYIALGHHWTLTPQWAIEAEIQHRSNLDIGFPVKGDTGTEEYDRNGFFVKARYMFNFVN